MSFANGLSRSRRASIHSKSPSPPIALSALHSRSDLSPAGCNAEDSKALRALREHPASSFPMSDNTTQPAGGRTHFVGFGRAIAQNCTPEIERPRSGPAPKSFRVAWFDQDHNLSGWTPWCGSEAAAQEAALERELRRPHLSEYDREIQDRPF